MPILEPVEPTKDLIVAIGLYQFVNHCNMCEIFMIVWLLYFTLQTNMIRRRVIFKKKKKKMSMAAIKTQW